jgi:hypothetical protein
MKRVTLLDRVAFIAEKRADLFEAGRVANQTGLTIYGRLEAERQLELRAVEFGLAMKRYLGGRT